MTTGSTKFSARQGLKFGATVGIAFGVIGSLLSWRGREIGAAACWTLSGVLILGGVIVPTRLGPVERAWMGLAHLISRVTTPIFMGLVYFTAITPIGILMRLLGKNPIAPHDSGGSFWTPRPQSRGSMDHQF